MTDKETRAREALDSLDSIAREHDIYEYGLPLHDDEVLGRMLDVMNSFAESSKAKEGPLTTFHCDCGRKLLVEGQVIGKEFTAQLSEPTGQAQEDICPRCESRYRNFKTLHCIADPHKWHSEEGRQWPREAQEAPKDITEDLYNCNTDVREEAPKESNRDHPSHLVD
jgi:hypothetical protein